MHTNNPPKIQMYRTGACDSFAPGKMRMAATTAKAIEDMPTPSPNSPLPSFGSPWQILGPLRDDCRERHLAPTDSKHPVGCWNSLSISAPSQIPLPPEPSTTSTWVFFASRANIPLAQRAHPVRGKDRRPPARNNSALRTYFLPVNADLGPRKGSSPCR
jgi:hypothetical protein